MSDDKPQGPPTPGGDDKLQDDPPPSGGPAEIRRLVLAGEPVNPDEPELGAASGTKPKGRRRRRNASWTPIDQIENSGLCLMEINRNERCRRRGCSLAMAASLFCFMVKPVTETTSNDKAW